jgi:hypothetical protein
MADDFPLVEVKPGGKSLGPLLALEVIAEHAFRSGMFKKYPNSSAAFVVCAFGYELGLSPVAALTSIHAIDGKPVMSGNLMLSLVYGSSTHDVRIKRRDNKGCTIAWHLKKPDGSLGELLGESSWTEADAQVAQLTGKDNWKKYARAMLFNRAVSDGFKVFCPHLAHGHTLYTPDELGADINADGEIVVAASTVRRETSKLLKPKAPAAPTVTLKQLQKLMEATGTDEAAVMEMFDTDLILTDLLDEEITQAYNLLTQKQQAMAQAPIEAELEPVPADEPKPKKTRKTK